MPINGSPPAPASSSTRTLRPIVTEYADWLGERRAEADRLPHHLQDVAREAMVIEVTGEETKVDSILQVLREYGILEVVRTGRIAMTRG